MKIVFASSEHLDLLAPLFDGYRTFYKQKSDIQGAKKFLKERIQLKDSTLLLAIDNKGKSLGFIQLYPIFSSVSMERMYLLNDLFVNADARGKGVGETLLIAAKEFCKKQKNKGLALQTAPDNPAQRLYQRLGWKPDSDLHFFWECK